jgi:flagellar hook-basal body complex protein FliE
MATPAIAAGAYASLARLTAGGGALGKTLGATTGPDFGALLQQAANAVSEIGHKADTQAQAVAAGKANVVDVVTAVAETETAVDALVSVRDRVIQSYKEIMQMPI